MTVSSTLNSVKPLQQPYDSVCHFGAGKLLAKADSRTAVERDEGPRPWDPRLPALRREGVDGREAGRDGWVDVGAMLHHQRGVADGRPFEDSHRAVAIWAASMWERGVF